MHDYYKIDFTPLEYYHFYAGIDVVGRQGSENETRTYSSISKRIPPQTSILGMLKWMLQYDNGNLFWDETLSNYKIQKDDVAKVLVGSMGFSFDKDSYGSIAAISQVILVNRDKETFLKPYFDHKEFTFSDSIEGKFISNNSRAVEPKNYCSSYKSKLKINSHFFTKPHVDTQIRVAKNENGTLEDQKYFEKEFYALYDRCHFRIYVKLKGPDHDEKNAIVTNSLRGFAAGKRLQKLGGEQNLFHIDIVPLKKEDSDHCQNVLKDDMQVEKELVCLSPCYIPTDLCADVDIIYARYSSYRFYSTKDRDNKPHYQKAPKSECYQLLDVGSIIQIKNTESSKNIESNTEWKNARTYGFNKLTPYKK